MRVLVTFRGVKPTPALREYAEHKVSRVEKYLHRPSDAHVVLTVVKRRHVAEVSLQASRTVLTAREETGDLYSAIDLAMDKIDRQARKLGKKRQDRKHQGRVPALREEPTAPTRRSALRTERVLVKPMSVDEALLQLKVAKNDFLLFKDSATEVLSVLYRRKDGRYALIEPEVS